MHNTQKLIMVPRYELENAMKYLYSKNYYFDIMRNENLLPSYSDVKVAHNVTHQTTVRVCCIPDEMLVVDLNDCICEFHKSLSFYGYEGIEEEYLIMPTSINYLPYTMIKEEQ